MIDKDLKQILLEKIHAINANAIYIGMAMDFDDDDKIRIENSQSIADYLIQRLNNEEET